MATVVHCGVGVQSLGNFSSAGVLYDGISSSRNRVCCRRGGNRLLLECHSPSTSHRILTKKPLALAIATVSFPRNLSRCQLGSVSVKATSVESAGEEGKQRTFPELKEFLEDLKHVGRVRIIVNTVMGVLESVTTLDKLFYKELPGKGEYGNVILQENNVDFHLLLNKVASIDLIQGKSMRGSFPTYTIRFYDSQKMNGASIFVMWKPGTDGEYDPGQVEGYEALLAKYGEHISFVYEGSEEASEL